MKKLLILALLGAYGMPAQIQPNTPINLSIVATSIIAAAASLEVELRKLSLEERASLHSKRALKTRINFLKSVAQEFKTNGLKATCRRFPFLLSGTSVATLLLASIPARTAYRALTAESTTPQTDLPDQTPDQTNQNSDTPQLTEAEQLEVQRQEKIARNRAEFERRAAADAQGNTRTAETPKFRDAEDSKSLVYDEAFFTIKKQEAAQARAEKRRLEEEQRRTQQEAEAERLRLEEEHRIEEAQRHAEQEAAERQRIVASIAQQKQEESSEQSGSSQPTATWPNSKNATDNLTAVDKSAQTVCVSKKIDATRLKEAQEAIQSAKGIEHAPHLALLAAYNALLNHPKNTAVAQRAAEVAVATLTTSLSVAPNPKLTGPYKTITAMLRSEALQAAQLVKPSTKNKT